MTDQPRSLPFSGSNGDFEVAAVRCIVPRMSISTVVPTSANSGRTVASASGLRILNQRVSARRPADEIPDCEQAVAPERVRVGGVVHLQVVRPRSEVMRLGGAGLRCAVNE